jgi:mRNA (guanine-N7-)-methyltransferase
MCLNNINMDCKLILDSLKKYEKEEFKSDFLTETIKYFKTKKEITELIENEYLLAGIKIHLMYNRYHIYLLSELKYKNVCFREINLSQKAANNFINQIDGIKNNNIIICNNLVSENVKFFLIISEKKLKNEEEISEDIYLPLLGINSLYFLEHQNLKSYCTEKYINESEELNKSLSKFRNKYNKLKLVDKEHFLIFSGLIYHFYGAIHTRDIDMIYVINDINESKKIYENFNEGLGELTMVYSEDLDNELVKEKNKDLVHNQLWKQRLFRYIFPNWGGAENIFEVLINPKYHFYFMGFKCIDINTNYQRTISRSHPFSVVDGLMIKKNNNLDLYKDFCVKNISIRKGKAEILTEKDLIYFKKTVLKYLKEWYKVSIPESVLDKIVLKCHEKIGTIYARVTQPLKNEYKDQIMISQIILHREISHRIIKEYAKKGDSLIDIGSGKSTGVLLYEELKLKDVYGIEPSTESIKTALDKIKHMKRKGSRINYNIINGFGDKPIEEYNINKKFEIITYTFTIHYMIENLDIVLQNILKLSRQGTIIIISLINGDKLKNKLRKDKRVEVRDDGGEIYWGVYKYNDDINKEKFKALFYMKEVYGVENGSEEWVVSPKDLINEFKKKDLDLIYNKSFLEEYESFFSNKKNKTIDFKNILDFQKEILNYQEILVFRKK